MQTNNYEDLKVGARIILKWTSAKEDCMVWTGFMKLRIETSDGLWVTGNTVMDLLVLRNVGKL
jgi:hypothetical protein